MCSAFSNVLDPQPDSLCHYTALMASIIGSVPEMHLDFGEELERREAECSALRGSNTQQFTVLLNHSEAAALSDRDFSAYATWFNQEMTDSVVSLRKRLELSDWDGLLRRIEHIDAEYAFLLGEARSRLDAMAYMGLLQGRATWEFRAANRDHLVTQLASMYERYPQSNRSGYNVLANLSPNQRSGVIFRDKYQKEWGALEACDALPGLGNILFDASHWRTLDPPKARAMVQQAVDSLARCSIATTNEAKAWRNLVRLSVPIAIEYDAVGSMGAFIKLMRAGRPVLEAHGELDKGGAAGEEYTLLLDLLQTAQERSVPTRGLESGLLGYLQRVDRTGDMAASLLASRAYAALVTRNPQAPPSPRILNHILTHLSDVLWYDYLVQNELLLTRDLSFQMNTFWSVVETALMKWDHPGSDLDTLLNIIPEALAIQLRLYAVNPQERIGSLDFCREELLDKLWDAHWARDPTKRQRDKEFTALYLATKRAFKDDRIHDMFADGGAQESIARFNAMLDQTGIAGGRRFMREEALTRYAEFGIEGLVDRANCFIRYPEIWSYFPTQASVALFNRNELSDSYQAVYMSADTVEVVNVGTIAAVEAAWREWLAAMENGNDALAAEKARIFWDPIVQRTASDAGVEQFVLVPDGIYYNVNPAALPIESTGRVRVDVVTDLFTYLLKSIPTNTMGPVYLFGGLDYGGEAPRTFALSASLRADRGLEHGRWMGLPGTKWEVDAIEGKFTRQEDLVFKGTGDSVSVTTLENMAFPRLVHIATHGFVYEGEGGAHSAGLVLSGANNETAEANRSYLYTERIRNLDLFACDAVILSACRTARSTSGSGQGEIIKAFKDAGTDKVIASSWAVPDECTALLMDKFYDYYLQGVSVSQALTEAQRKVAERYPEKRYWAAFMVYE
ncbi:MAG: CHAT domain-containing protein [Flavobacteriales bacterium]|nr:CHAT domain-containing protein [Flavobacteriales bacterium]